MNYISEKKFSQPTSINGLIVLKIPYDPYFAPPLVMYKYMLHVQLKFSSLIFIKNSPDDMPMKKGYHK